MKPHILQALRTDLEEAESNLEFARQAANACRTAQGLDAGEAYRRERRSDKAVAEAMERVRLAKAALRKADSSYT